MPEAPVRKLAAILAADIVGYSRLIERDEAGTVTRLKSDREEFIDPTIAGHGGRIVRLAGDGALVEFPSVVEATQCAIDVQRGMPARNADRAEDQQIIFRIGVNLGDIIVEEDNLHGEGINVAARLESLCEPGGILLSEQAWHQVDGKIDAGLEFVEERTVKNIERPVRIWRVLLDQLPARGTSRPMRRRRRIPWNIAIPGGLAIAALAVALFWYQPWAPRVDPTDVEPMAFSLSDKPSIAVLPFDNLSGDPEDQFLADGLSEDIITTLSRVPSLLIIARNSTFTYKGKAVKVQQVATELGVRYVLEGSVQRSGDQLRVTAQFIDATTGHHLWADRFDRKVEDIFALQDEIAHKILIELQVKLTTGEHARVASRGTKSLEAWLLRLQGRAAGSSYDKEGMLKAREIFWAATRADPTYARAWGGIAWTYWFEARLGGWTNSRDEALKKGVEFAERAIEVDPNEPLVYIIMSYLLSLMGEYDRSIVLVERAMAMAPGDFQSTANVGVQLVWAGDPGRAIEFFEKAKRLSPKYPPWIDWMEGVAQLMVGRPDNALTPLRRGVDRAPKSFLARGRLVAGYAALDRLDEAKAESAELLKIRPDMTASKFANMHPFKYSEHKELLRDLLLKAGLPDEKSS